MNGRDAERKMKVDVDRQHGTRLEIQDFGQWKSYETDLGASVAVRRRRLTILMVLVGGDRNSYDPIEGHRQQYQKDSLSICVVGP